MLIHVTTCLYTGSVYDKCIILALLSTIEFPLIIWLQNLGQELENPATAPRKVRRALQIYYSKHDPL